MKDTARQPTKMARLREIEQRLTNWHAEEGVMPDDDIINDAIEWITWTYNFLDARRLYHKKHTVKNALLRKMAETLLSPDELERIDQEAEDKL
jgi:hypothetical protein